MNKTEAFCFDLFDDDDDDDDKPRKRRRRRRRRRQQTTTSPVANFQGIPIYPGYPPLSQLYPFPAYPTRTTPLSQDEIDRRLRLLQLILRDLYR